MAASVFSDCSLDLSMSNFTLAASKCSSGEDRGKCCRHLHSLVANSVSRDTTFAALASCFFGVQGLNLPPVWGHFPSSPPPQASSTLLIAASPAQLSSSPKRNNHDYHLTLVPIIGISVTALAVVILVLLIILIRKKSKELDSDTDNKTSSKSIPHAARKYQDDVVLPNCSGMKI